MRQLCLAVAIFVAIVFSADLSDCLTGACVQCSDAEMMQDETCQSTGWHRRVTCAAWEQIEGTISLLQMDDSARTESEQDTRASEPTDSPLGNFDRTADSRIVEEEFENSHLRPLQLQDAPAPINIATDKIRDSGNEHSGEHRDNLLDIDLDEPFTTPPQRFSRFNAQQPTLAEVTGDANVVDVLVLGDSNQIRESDKTPQPAAIRQNVEPDAILPHADPFDAISSTEEELLEDVRIPDFPSRVRHRFEPCPRPNEVYRIAFFEACVLANAVFFAIRVKQRKADSRYKARSH